MARAGGRQTLQQTSGRAGASQTSPMQGRWACGGPLPPPFRPPLTSTIAATAGPSSVKPACLTAAVTWSCCVLCCFVLFALCAWCVEHHGAQAQETRRARARRHRRRPSHVQPARPHQRQPPAAVAVRLAEGLLHVDEEVVQPRELVERERARAARGKRAHHRGADRRVEVQVAERERALELARVQAAGAVGVDAVEPLRRFGGRGLGRGRRSSRLLLCTRAQAATDARTLRFARRLCAYHLQPCWSATTVPS